MEPEATENVVTTVDAVIANVVNLVSVWGLKLLGAVVIFFVGKWIIRKLTNGLGHVMERNKVDPTLVRFLSNLAYFALLTMLVIAVLGHIGVNTGSFIAVIGAAGLAIGFALQGSLSNFAAGVLLILFRPFKVGDLVDGGDTLGVIKEIQIFATVLITPDGKKVIVPNAAIAGGNITNYSAEGKIRIDMVFGIGYGDDIDKAKEILSSVLASDERVLKEPAFTVAMCELGDSSVNFATRPWVHPSHYWDVLFDTHEKVKKAFDAQGVSIPFPQRDVHMHHVTGEAA